MEQSIESVVRDLQDLPFINFSVNKNLIQTFWLDKELREKTIEDINDPNCWYMPLCEKNSIVLYGIGKVGKRLFRSFNGLIKGKLVAICDNNYGYKSFDDIPVFKQDECLKRYPNSTFLITPQKGFLSIALSLNRNGIDRKNIFFYNARRCRLDFDSRESIKTSHFLSSLSDIKHVIIYGIGKVGKRVYFELKRYYDIEIEAICDNSFPQKYFGDIPVYGHSECIKKYPDIFYIITPQTGYLDIAYKLQDNGVNIHNISFFDNARSILERI